MFIPENLFRPYQDLDGKAAAQYLKEQGFDGVAYADLGTNGLAVGVDNDGGLVALSTNGNMSFPDHSHPMYKRFLDASPTILY